MRLPVALALLVPACALGFAPARGLKRPPRAAVARRMSSTASSAPRLSREPPSELPPLLRKRSASAVWSVAWPTIAIGLLQTSYSAVDALYIGRLGAAPLEAVGAASFALWLIYILGGLPAAGVHVVSSEAEGAGQRERVGEELTQGLWMCAVISSGFALAALSPLLGGYFDLLDVRDPQVRAAGMAYLRAIALGGSLPLAAGSVAAAAFKGIGDTRPALYVNAAGVLLNAVLDPLLIWGAKLGPLRVPALGVAGAAYATSAAETFALVLSLVLLVRKRAGARAMWPRPRAVARNVRIGAPMAASGVLFSGVYLAIARVLSSLGDGLLGALGLGQRIEGFAWTICYGFSSGASTLVGQWLGAGSVANARRAAAAASTTAALVMVPFGAIAVLAAEQLTALFTTDAAIAGPAASYLRVTGAAFPAMAMEMTYEGSLAGGRCSSRVLAIGLFLNTARVPLASILARRRGPLGGATGVWLAIAGTTTVKALLKYLAFRSAPLRTRTADESGGN